MSLPLEGIKVLDLTRLLPGPFCSLILADLGANVLKVEDTQGGDYARWTPPYNKNMSAYFLALNRNKKSIKLNLKSEEGKEIFKKLVNIYDIIIESFRPGVMERLGLGYEDLKKVNPGLIFCSISGYGQDGPYRDLAGHDINYIAIAGVLGLTGKRDATPALPGAQIADIGGGSLFAVVAILSAIIYRMKTRKGQYIDTSMMDGAFSFLAMHLMKYLVDKEPMGREGLRLNGEFICYNVYETKDGKYVSLGALEPKFWKAFCNVVNRDDLIDEAYATGERFYKMKDEMLKIFKNKTLDEWIKLSKENDFCCMPVNENEDILNDPQIKHRGLIFEMDHPKEGKIKQIRLPFRMSSINNYRTEPHPDFGEHTEEVLHDLGYNAQEIDEMRNKGVI